MILNIKIYRYNVKSKLGIVGNPSTLSIYVQMSFLSEITFWSLRVQDNVAGGLEEDEVHVSLTVSWMGKEKSKL